MTPSQDSWHCCLLQPPWASSSTALQNCHIYFPALSLCLFPISPLHIYSRRKSLTMFFRTRRLLFMCKRSDLGIITLMKRLLSGPDLHTGYCAVVLNKRRLRNCFIFILYLSSFVSVTPWDAGSWRCFPLSALHQTGAAVQLQSFCTGRGVWCRKSCEEVRKGLCVEVIILCVFVFYLNVHCVWYVYLCEYVCFCNLQYMLMLSRCLTLLRSVLIVFILKWKTHWFSLCLMSV